VGTRSPIRVEAVGHERQDIDFLYLFRSFSVHALDDHRRNFLSRLDGSRHLKISGAQFVDRIINIRNYLEFHCIMDPIDRTVLCFAPRFNSACPNSPAAAVPKPARAAKPRIKTGGMAN
jgi:hypothetical protein